MPTTDNITLSDLPQSANVSAYWKFDEASGTRYDETSNGNDLTDGNSNVARVDGRNGVGYAGVFDPDITTYLYRTDANLSSDLKLSSDFTVNAWVYALSPGSIDIEPIIGHYRVGNAAAGGWSLDQRLDSDGRFLGFFYASSTPYLQYSTSTITNNTWTMVTFSYDADGGTGSSGLLSIYLDGDLDNSSDGHASGFSVSTGTPLRVGHRSSDTTPSNVNVMWDGYLDELAVWDVCLNSSEVSTMYSTFVNNGSSGGSLSINIAGYTGVRVF